MSREPAAPGAADGARQGRSDPTAGASPPDAAASAPLGAPLPPSPGPAAPGARSSGLARIAARLLTPLRAQLTQGTSPDKLALTLGVGTACSLLPFLGFTTLLNLGVGLALRLNQPILQILNQLLGPVQLVLILGYVRLGEALWREKDSRFSVSEMIAVFRDASVGEFLSRFGWAGVHAFTAWLLTSPLLVVVVLVLTLPALRRFQSGIDRRAANPP